MKKRIILLGLVWVIVFTGRGNAQGGHNGPGQSVYDTIQNRIYMDLREPVGSLAKSASQALSTMSRDGSWADIQYKNSAITIWSPGIHLRRLETMVLAYAEGVDVSGGRSALYQGIVAGLRYWYTQDPKSSNWWHNEISVPKTLGQLLIALRYAPEQTPVSLEDSVLARMKRGDILKMTGANKLDVAIHFLYRAVLTRNDRLMDTAVQQAFQPVNFTTEEGLQQDYSYLQHGPQLQLSSYGAVFLSGEYKVAKYVRGTPYALADTALNKLSTYYNESYLRAIRGQYIDFNVEGRGVSRPDMLSKVSEKRLLDEARLVDPARATDWYAAMARTSGVRPADYAIRSGHTHYWRGDYSMHIRPAYSFNVRLVSTRTRRTETGNKENLFGRYMPDGSTNIQVKGDEYYNIMPVWEWDKIPGVTAVDHPEDVLMDKAWGEPGSTNFAGGVSDSLYGVSAYDMDYDGVKAKKSWFFFDRSVVCLGAGISGGNGGDIITTVNQCWLKGSVKIGDVSGRASKTGVGHTAVLKDPYYVWQDGVGYVFPEGGSLTLSTVEQKGSWYRINNAHSKKNVSGDVFKLWMDHGANPSNGKYVYAVIPGMVEEMSHEAAAVRVVVNSDTLQAVRHAGLKMLQAVFYKPGVLVDSGIRLQVDRACILLLKIGNNGSVVLSVADPTQSEKEVSVSVRMADIGLVNQLCLLPQGVYAGSTVSYELRKSDAFTESNFSFAQKQLKTLLDSAEKKDTLFPRSTNDRGEIVATSLRDWTGGFFPGCLWYVYERTGDTILKEAAIRWTEKLAPMQYFTEHHDLGFVLYSSFGNAYRLTGDRRYADVLVQAAKSLATRYKENVGCIKSWNSFSSWHGGAPYTYPVIIDNMMNLELLFFASKVSGDPRYREIAVRHAETTMKNQVRQDYSCYHVVCYDPVTGAVLARETAQGYSDNSAWSRGQAWGIYGFTVAYRETKDLRFLTTARKMADFYLKNKRLPADKVPYWDFNVNDAGYVPGIKSGAKEGAALMLRDASAAAVTASALLELAEYLGEDGAMYRRGAQDILNALGGVGYRAEPGSNGGFLLKHSVGSIPHGFEVDKPLIYADYYFLEALTRNLKMGLSDTGKGL